MRSSSTTTVRCRARRAGAPTARRWRWPVGLRMPASASGCGEAMPEKIRIAVLHFAHETVTFLKNDTTLDHFIQPGAPARGEELLKPYPKPHMGGFVKMPREFDGVELVGIESPLWPKTYMGSGWVTDEAF